jgi:uracil-DNA glycosylase family 4
MISEITQDEFIRKLKARGWLDEEIGRAWVSRSRCTLCQLSKKVDTGFIKVPSRGSINADILVVGESPGYEESKRGLSFVGPAAQHGEDILKNIGIPPEKVRYANTVKCFSSVPGDRHPAPTKPSVDIETACCIDYLWDEIEKLQPRVIVALGAHAAEALLRQEIKSITAVSGSVHMVSIRGKDYPVVLSPHFSADIRSGGRYLGQITKAFSIANDIIDDSEIPVTCKILNSTEEAISFLDELIERYEAGEFEAVAYDLEWDTLVSGITRDEASKLSGLDLYNPDRKVVAASFATSSSEGVCIPLYGEGSKTNPEEVQPAIARALSKIPIICHNYSKAEGPWSLRKFGIKPILYADTMLMSYTLHMKTCVHGLKPLASRFLGWRDWSREVDKYIDTLPVGSQSYKNIPVDILGKYSAIDPAATYGLYKVLNEKVIEEGLQNIAEMLRKAAEDFLDIEQRGAFIDLDYLNRLKEIYPVEEQRAYETLLNLPEVKEYEQETGKEFSPGSPEQVGDVLYGKLKAEIRIPTDNDEVAERMTPRMFPCALVPGDEKFPIDVDIDKETFPKTLWAESKTGERAERLKVKEYNGDYVTLRKPIKYPHKAPLVLRLGSPTTNEETILSLIGNLPKDGTRQNLREFLLSFRKYKKISKMLNSYVNSIPDYLVPTTNQIVFNYLIHGTDTGRMSTKDFSLQTLPKKSDIRRLFISKWHNEGGVILSMDHSQLEMRLAAAVANDDELRKAYLTCVKCDRVADVSEFGVCKYCGEDLGQDLHTYTASLVCGVKPSEVTSAQRSFAKTVNFGVLYGRGPKALSAATGMSIRESVKFIKTYFEKFRGLKSYIEDKHLEFEARGYVYSPVGRKLPLEGWQSISDFMVARGKREAQNYGIQSAGSDITLIGLGMVKQELLNEGLRSVPWEFTHDSIEYDVYPGEIFDTLRIATECMTVKTMNKCPWITVPLVTSKEIGARWDGTVDVKGIDYNKRELTVSGKKVFFEETINQLKKSNSVSYTILKEWEKEEDTELVAKVGYTVFDGGSLYVEAIIKFD